MNSKRKNRRRIRRALKREQNGKCFYCSLRMLDGDETLEHLLAQSLGGDDSWKNLRVAHAKCNVIVGVLPVVAKLRLHQIGHILGSDAFFQEISSMTVPGQRAKKRKNNVFGIPKNTQLVVEEVLDDSAKSRVAMAEMRLHQRLWPAAAA